MVRALLGNPAGSAPRHGTPRAAVVGRGISARDLREETTPPGPAAQAIGPRVHGRRHTAAAMLGGMTRWDWWLPLIATVVAAGLTLVGILAADTLCKRRGLALDGTVL